MKLKITELTRPITMVPRARLGAPQVRMKLFTPRPMHCRMNPEQMIWMNTDAWGRTSSVALDRSNSQSVEAGNHPRKATITAMTRLRDTTLPRARSASSRRPSPSRRAASALPPLPTSMAMAMNTTIMGFATVMADRPISPTAWPRNTESMMA